jgi:hypothetical protein
MQRAPARGPTHNTLLRAPHVNKDAVAKVRKLSLPIHVEHTPSVPTRLPGSTTGEYTTVEPFFAMIEEFRPEKARRGDDNQLRS